MLRFYLFKVLCLLLTQGIQGQLAQFPTNYKGRQIQIGSGGGFSGSTTTYYLLDNGRLFRRTTADTVISAMGRLSKRTTDQLFKQLEKQCRIQTTNFDHPGNLYQFIGYQQGNARYTVTWGAEGYLVPTAYKNFYKQFLLLLPNAKSVSSIP